MLITSDTDLRQYIPNTLVTVSGEQTLFDKLQVELQLSEAWIVRTFSVVESTPTACKVLATDAFLRAVPSLDLVLTPNGFGVISNNTIASEITNPTTLERESDEAKTPIAEAAPASSKEPR